MSTEFNGLEELAQSRKTYSRNYYRERERGCIRLRLKPSINNKLRSYYQEYCMKCQLSHYIPVDFNSFVLEFCEIGFLQWREGNKGK